MLGFRMVNEINVGDVFFGMTNTYTLLANVNVYEVIENRGNRIVLETRLFENGDLNKFLVDYKNHKMKTVHDMNIEQTNK